MSIICPEITRIYRPNAQPGDVLIFEIGNDINVTDTDGLPVFFSSSLIERADDINNTTFFPTAQPGGFRNAGSITNDGSQIEYTVDQTMEAGDCILIQYTATNTTELRESDCTQFFEVCFREDDSTQEPRPIDCLDGDTLAAGTTGILSAVQLGGGVANTEFRSFFVTDANGQAVQVDLVTGSNSELDFSNLGPGVYTLQYVVRRDGVDSLQCTVFYTVGGVVNATCFDGILRYSQIQYGLPASELSSADGATFFSTPDTFDTGGNRLAGGQLSADRTRYSIPTPLLPGATYTIRYAVQDPQGIICRSEITYIHDVTTEFTGNNLDCGRTRWINGTPQITCGGAPTTHVAELWGPNNTPFIGQLAVQFIQQQFPPGVVVTVRNTQNNLYEFTIDPSNAECIGTSNASIGI